VTQEEQRCACCQDDQARRDKQALPLCGVDDCASRGLDCDSDESAEG